jgi:hypothetical protein
MFGEVLTPNFGVTTVSVMLKCCAVIEKLGVLSRTQKDSIILR